MEKRDYYNLLGISPNATEIEIKKAYRALAIQYHPDKNQGDPQSESLFKEITEAYRILLHPRDHALYDQFGHSLESAELPEKEDERFGLMGAMFNIASDVFDVIFGGGNDRKFRVIRGNNLKYKIDLTFTEAALGREVPISYHRLQSCDSCKGTGALAGTRPIICPRCRGRGEEKTGNLMVKTSCIGCGGKGKIISSPCLGCGGEGRVKRKRELTILIPPGTEDGDVVKIQTEGEAGENSGPYGDLYVVIHVKKHPLFRKVKNNILMDISIGFPEAALGTEVKIPTLTKECLLKISPGIQTGKIISLQGKGIPLANGKKRGDLQVRVQVQTPSSLGKRERKLYRDLAGTKK